MARGDDLIATIARLRTDVAELKRLGASRWGVGPLIRKGGASPTSGAGGVMSLSFATAFPTACDNVVFSFGNTSNTACCAFKTGQTASGFTLVLTDSRSGAALVGFSVEIDYWAWGH